MLPFPKKDPAEAAAPRGITGPCAPHSPGVGTREQAEHVRGCAGVPGPRAVISGKHLPSGECASLDQWCPPNPSVRDVSGWGRGPSPWQFPPQRSQPTTALGRFLEELAHLWAHGDRGT